MSSQRQQIFRCLGIALLLLCIEAVSGSASAAARFAYVADFRGATISAYSINPLNGTVHPKYSDRSAIIEVDRFSFAPSVGATTPVGPEKSNAPVLVQSGLI
jgi:hypothetical protein